MRFFSNHVEPNRANFCSNWFHAITHSSKKNDFRGHPTINYYYPEHICFNFPSHFSLQSHLSISSRITPRYNLNYSNQSSTRSLALIVYLFSLQASILSPICPVLFCFNVWFNACSSTHKLCVDWVGANEAYSKT